MSQLETLVAGTEGLQPWRRILHGLSGLTIAGALTFLDPSWEMATLVLGVLALLFFLADLLRLARPELNQRFFRWFRLLVSPREAEGIASSTWFMIGVFLAVAIFPRAVVIPSILVLALADPAASYAGRRWGGRHFGGGTLLGSVVFLLVTVLALLPFVGPTVAVVVALMITLIEPAPWPVDDNLVIPLITGAVLWSLLPFWR